MKLWQKLMLAAFAVVVLGGLLMLIPPVRERVMFRFDQLRLRVFYTLNPPEENVFQPQEDVQVAEIVRATLTEIVRQTTPTATQAAQATATATPMPDAPTAAPTATLPPLPGQALLEDVPYVDQHYGFNNCAPANLTMALKYWGWPGAREDVSEYVKPFPKDKNVMPYELADYVNTETGLRALVRMGGNLDIIKRLVSAGFPPLVERGVFLRDLSGKVSWMGHYQVVYGYDDEKSQFQVKDSFENGGDHLVETYEEMITGWRSFTYTFIVVYPPEREGEVLALLGPYADETIAFTMAAQNASDEAASLTGQEQFFAMFNRGSALVKLQDYNGAAEAYDEAFRLYAELAGTKRPWRIVWYQTGPYFAYFNTGRMQDVIGLADKTIKAASEPYLEESFYWRARAKSQTGDTQGAIDDLRKSLEYHPNFDPALSMLQLLGATP
jgi:tetratricopeptide (TPR) repeat protein